MFKVAKNHLNVLKSYILLVATLYCRNKHIRDICRRLLPTLLGDQGFIAYLYGDVQSGISQQ